jgi:hypothetical protein
MGRVFRLAAVAVSCTALSFAGPILFGSASNGQLYTISSFTTSGSPATVTTSTLGGVTTALNDLAEFNGVLYGIGGTSDPTLYIVNQSTGALTSVGTVAAGTTLLALTFSPTGTLYAAGSTAQLFVIDPNTGNILSTTTTSQALNASGGLADIGGTLFLTTGGVNADSADSLVAINPTTGAVTAVGATGFDDVFAIAVVGGTLYGFTDPEQTGPSSTSPNVNQVITINTTTGAGTLVGVFNSAGPGFFGATADIPTPEPGTLGAMGLGLLGLGSIAYRRRKA